MKYGFVRVASASPSLQVADCEYNASSIIDCIKKASLSGVEVLVFGELCITGYTCGDLFLQEALQERAIKELSRILQETRNTTLLAFVGLPIQKDGMLYNCAAILHRGKVVAVIPKTFIPNYNEFYEYRWFASATSLQRGATLHFSFQEEEVPFSTNIIIRDTSMQSVAIAAEICEDLWAPLSPSIRHAIQGATIIVNLSASNEIIGKADYRRQLVKTQSAKLLCAYIYANADIGESTTDLVYSSHKIIAENGNVLSESLPFDTSMIVSDIDTQHLLAERQRTTTFARDSYDNFAFYTSINASFCTEEPCKNLQRYISATPFVPEEISALSQRAQSVLQLQCYALAKRLSFTKSRAVVLGLSGGLDSTLAALVCKGAFDILEIAPNGIYTITMPCFGTTSRTLQNARTLSHALGTTLCEIPIETSVKQHFFDIKQDENCHDTTYENCQARERTQVLMDMANKLNALVIGTGDLSELALGWATYNGDHISMYGVNASIPKTLVQHLVRYCAQKTSNNELCLVLKDILDTPVSPELLPPENDTIVQQTQDLVGPYILHDFFLYHALRYGEKPSKIYYTACIVFEKKYAPDTILKWLRVFYKRFFANQFKRSCLPDGAKVGTISISPRGDWRMPSDAVARVWQDDIENLEKN